MSRTLALLLAFGLASAARAAPERAVSPAGRPEPPLLPAQLLGAPPVQAQDAIAAAQGLEAASAPPLEAAGPAQADPLGLFQARPDGAAASAQAGAPARGTCPITRIREALDRLRRFADRGIVIAGVRPPQPVETRRQLTEVFHPLVSRLGTATRASSDAEVLGVLERVSARGSIRRGVYDGSPGHRWTRLEVEDGAPEPVKAAAASAQGIMDLNADKALTSFNLDAGASRSRELLWVAAAREDAENPRSILAQLTSVTTPITAYGEPLSRALLRTTEVMVELAKDTLAVEARRAGSEHAALLAAHTARADPASPEENPALAAAIEGIVSLHQLMANLLSSGVPGAASPADAVRALIFDAQRRDGLISDITRRLPMGLNGPLNMAGRYFNRPLERTAGGKLALTAAFRKVLAAHGRRTSRRHSRGVCPVAVRPAGGPRGEKAGLQLLAEAYWRVFSVVARQAL